VTRALAALLLLAACHHGATTASGPAVTARAAEPPPGPHVWEYQGQIQGPDDDAPRWTGTLRMVESWRRQVRSFDGASQLDVIELRPQIDGSPATGESLAARGFASVPLDAFGPVAYLVFGPAPAYPTWLFWLDPGEEQMVNFITGETKPTWTLGSGTRSSVMGAPVFDAPVQWDDRTGTWPSLCASYDHPAPDSGASWASGVCLAADVGITRLSYRSAWGSYDFRLARAPAGFSTPAIR
jgi:hypothetical protein